MTNNNVANGIIASIGLAMFTGVFITDFALSETLYMIAGLGMMVFGIWAVVILKKG